MINRLRTVATGLMMFGFIASSMVAVVLPSRANALAPNSDCNAYFLTFPAWYNGIAGKSGGECMVVSPKDLGGEANTQLSRFIWLIVLNGLQILLQVVAYLSVGFITYGGFVYLTSAGRSDKITRGREMIQNAVIGLVISLLAVALVAYVGGQIKV